MITKHKTLYFLGNNILKNTLIRNNFYNIPPKEYLNYEEKQCKLLRNYINETNLLTQYWRENNKHMNFYLLRDYGSNKMNFEK